MSPEEIYYREVGNSLQDSMESQMFGKPCFKINKKAFICFFQNQLVCKLNQPFHEEAMALEGSILFDPSGKGRAMKEWVQISFKHKSEWAKFAEHARKYLLA